MELDFLSKTSNSCDMLFSDMAEIYMDDCKARIRPTTYKGKEDIIEVHIMPYFRNLKVNEIQLMNVRRWQTELMNNQKNYKPTCTQRGSSAQLRACVAMASAMPASSSTIKILYISNPPWNGIQRLPACVRGTVKFGAFGQVLCFHAKPKARLPRARGRAAAVFAIDLRKIECIGVAHRMRGHGDRQTGVAQQNFRLCQPVAREVFLGRKARLAVKNAAEIFGRHPHPRGKLGNAERHGVVQMDQPQRRVHILGLAGGRRRLRAAAKRQHVIQLRKQSQVVHRLGLRKKLHNVRLGGLGRAEREDHRLVRQPASAQQLRDLVGVEARAVVPGHIQRGGSPNAYDRVLSTQFGVHAAELIRDGVYGVTVALKGNEITHNKLSDIAGVPKLVPPDNTMITTARNIGISFGD